MPSRTIAAAASQQLVRCRMSKRATAKLRALHTSPEYVLDMYDPEFVKEYDHCVEHEYGKVDHQNVPKWIIEEHAGAGGDALRVLDLGCGTGISSRLFFEQATCSVVGVDLTPAMCNHARETQPFESVVCQSIEAPLPFEDAAFDASIMLGVLEFIANPAIVASEVRRVLKTGGLFGCSVPIKVDYDTEKRLGVQTYEPEAVHAMFEAAGFIKVREEQLHGYTLDYPESRESLTINYVASMWRAV